MTDAPFLFPNEVAVLEGPCFVTCHTGIGDGDDDGPDLDLVAYVFDAEHRLHGGYAGVVRDTDQGRPGVRNALSVVAWEDHLQIVPSELPPEVQTIILSVEMPLGDAPAMHFPPGLRIELRFKALGATEPTLRCPFDNSSYEGSALLCVELRNVVGAWEVRSVGLLHQPDNYV